MAAKVVRGDLSRTEVKGDPWSAEHLKYMAPWHKSGTGRLARQDKMSFERIGVTFIPGARLTREISKRSEDSSLENKPSHTCARLTREINFLKEVRGISISENKPSHPWCTTDAGDIFICNRSEDSQFRQKA